MINRLPITSVGLKISAQPPAPASLKKHFGEQLQKLVMSGSTAGMFVIPKFVKLFDFCKEAWC